jgi:hypothetical protein
MFPDDGSSNQIPTDIKLKDIDVFVEAEVLEIWHLLVNGTLQKFNAAHLY